MMDFYLFIDSRLKWKAHTLSIKTQYDLTEDQGWFVGGGLRMNNHCSVGMNRKTSNDCTRYYAESNDVNMKIKEMVNFWNDVDVK